MSTVGYITRSLLSRSEIITSHKLMDQENLVL